MDIKKLEEPINYWEILDQFSDGIYLTNAEGLTLGVNKAYEQITGIRAEEVMGRYMKDIVQEGTLSVSITNQIIATGEEATAEQRTKDGSRVIINGRPIKDEAGRVKYVLTIVRDMTAIDALQNEVKKFRQLAQAYKEQLKVGAPPKKYVAHSQAFRRAVDLAHKVASIDSTVLILGESGTGKEIIAREIHECSHRAKERFLKINCGAIPENLLESELFGYAKGAFTGAAPGGYVGVFESAHKGTVFLDEIGDMPLLLQTKLLRVLQDKVIMRVGSNTPVQVDTRIIAATNADIERMVEDGRFRKDLYFRLDVVQIDTPPLRQRKEDIPELVEFFVAKINQKYNLNKRIQSDLVRDLYDYDWPGNVRELENVIERIMVTSNQDYISRENTPLQFKSGTLAAADTAQCVITGIVPMDEAVEKVEKYLLEEAAKTYKTTYAIADALGISQPSVSRKMSKYRQG